MNSVPHLDDLIGMWRLQLASEIMPIFKQLKKIITPKFLNFHLVHPLTSYNPIIDSSAEGWICGTPRYFITCKRLIANLHVYLHITLAG